LKGREREGRQTMSEIIRERERERHGQKYNET